MLSHHMTMQNFPSKNMSSHVEMQVNKERARLLSPEQERKDWKNTWQFTPLNMGLKNK